jgi:hypothetical protein
MPIKMPEAAAEARSKSVARFNVPGRKLPKMPAGDAARGDSSGSIKPRLARHGWIRFLTLKDLDARSRAASFTRNLASALESDLGGDPSIGQKQLVQRAAILSAICEDFETRHLLGEPIELVDYLTTTNVLRRVLATLGLERKAREVGPTLDQYLRSRYAPEEKAIEANGYLTARDENERTHDHLNGNAGPLGDDGGEA